MRLIATCSRQTCIACASLIVSALLAGKASALNCARRRDDAVLVPRGDERRADGRGAARVADSAGEALERRAAGAAAGGGGGGEADCRSGTQTAQGACRQGAC